MSLFQTVNQLAELSASRRVEWAPVDGATRTSGEVVELAPGGSTGPPINTGDQGVSLKNSPKFTYKVDLRRFVSTRTLEVEVVVLSLVGNYTVTIDGTPSTYDATADAPADLAALVTGWATAINGTAVVQDVVLATAIDTDGDELVDRLLIQGKSWPDYAAIVAAPAPAEVTVRADPCSGTAHVHLSPMTTNPPAYPAVGGQAASIGWVRSNGGVYTLAFRGLAERGDCGGWDRAYIELENVVGPPGDAAGTQATLLYTVRRAIGPAIPEGV